MRRQPSIFNQSRLLIRDFKFSIRFSGAQNVSFPSKLTNAFLANGQYTWLWWMNFQALGANNIMRIMTKGSGIRITADRSNWYCQNLNTFTSSRVKTPFPQYQNKWACYGLTFDGINRQTLFYVNGLPYGSSPFVDSTFWTDTRNDTTSPIIIGSNFANEGGTYLMDEFVFSNTVLTPDQMLDAYIRGSYGSNLGIYAKFDEGNGLVATDSSGNSNNGVISGGTYSSLVVMKPRIAKSDRVPVSRNAIAKSDRVNPLGISSHLERVSAPQVIAQLDLMQAMGIKYIRQEFVWSAIEGTQGVFNWATYDNIVTQALSRGFKIIALLSQYGIPSWASTNPGGGANYPPIASAYQQWCQDFATHYAGQITLFEMGNEPNQAGFWAPFPDPAAYTAILKAGYRGIKAVNTSYKVISGGLSNSATTTVNAYATIGFLQGIYANGGQGFFDYFGIHPYCQPAAPQAGFNLLDQCLQIMTLNGDGGKKMFITEFGYPTSTFNGGIGVLQSMQANFLTQAYQMITYGKYNFVNVLCIYDFVNDGTDPANSENNFGLVKTDLTVKPAYTALQKIASYFNNNFNAINA